MGSNANSIAAAALKDFIVRAKRACEDLPDLQDAPTPRLGLNLLVPKSIELKSSCLQDLDILNQAVTRLQQRIDVPVLIGVIGEYSVGKSSLLNSFFRHALDGASPPDELLRPTSNEVTDTIFTYITHSEFASRFKRSDDIDVIGVNHDLFRTLNFIDTPGTGWKKFTKRDVCDLMSTSDVILYLWTPKSILNQLSVDALSIKFSTLPEVPLWFVITHASEYTNKFGDWKSLRLEEFKSNLKGAKDKRAREDSGGEADLKARDLVMQRVDFKLGENTFLVDAKHDYGVDKLLKQILNTFGTGRAKAVT
jgi:predicted GTPase